MKSVIKDIYLGKCGFNGTIKMSETHKETLATVFKMTEEYKKSFNEEQQRKFLEFCDLNNLLDAENALSHYKEGFKLGMLLALECCGALQ